MTRQVAVISSERKMMTKKKWENTGHYQRILQILEDYWLTEPEEAYVAVDMEFLKSDGQYQQKHIVWWNPNMDSEKTSAMLKQKHKDMQEAYEEAKREGLFINLGEE